MYVYLSRLLVDGMKTTWPTGTITDIVRDYVRKNGLDAV
jgi:hypothetical protein